MRLATGKSGNLALVFSAWLLMFGTSRATYTFRFADASGQVTDNFTIPFVGGVTDIRVYLEQTSPTVDLSTTGLAAYGVRLNFGAYSSLVTVGAAGDISPALPFHPTFPLNVVGSGFAASDSIVPSNGAAIADSNGRVLLATFRFTGLAPGLAAIVSADAHADPFADTLLATSSGAVIDSQIANRAALITVLSPELPGDYNADGVVDGADYVVYRNGLGTTFTSTSYDIWRAHFGNESSGLGSVAAASAGQPESSAMVVPEPTWAALLTMVAVVVICAPRSLEKRQR
jgi:hypothetical protein